MAAGGAEIYRNTETDPTARCYPGGYFDPLGLADGRGADRLKEVRFLASSVSPWGFLFLLLFSDLFSSVFMSICLWLGVRGKCLWFTMCA